MDEDTQQRTEEDRLAAREQAVRRMEEGLSRRENTLLARELLAERHLPGEALALIDLATPDTVKNSLAALESLRGALAPTRQAPRAGGQEESAPQTYARCAEQYLRRRGY